MSQLKQGQAVKTSKSLIPFYSGYAGNPNIVIHEGSIGIVADSKAFKGDVIIDFPIDTSDLTIQGGYTERPIDKVWRVRMTKAEAKKVLSMVETPEWLVFDFWCGALRLLCEVPVKFNRLGT
jgi:hypothetical protein